MTKVVFETATIQDAIKKAARVAPSRGEAFDKASGVLIEVNPDQEPAVTVRSTNLDIFYTEWVDTVEVDGGPAVWRVPASLLASMVGSLPIGSGKSVTFEEVPMGAYMKLMVSSGKTKARFNLMQNDYYPTWDVFDPDDLTMVNDLGGRISMVEWAADSTTVPISGLYFTGSEIITTDRYRLARTQLKIKDMPENHVIVPAGILGSVLKQTGEVRVGFTEHQMLLMPNDTTQLRVVRYDTQYPPGIGKIMDNKRPNFVEFPKADLIAIMNRANVFSGADRFPTIRLFLGAEEIAVMVDNSDVGTIADVIDVPGQCDHRRVEMKFTPKNLAEALDKAPNDRVRIGYDPEVPSKILYIDGGSGYEAWVVTKREGEGSK